MKARIETPTGHKDLVRIEEVTIVLDDEALAEIVKVVSSQQGFAPDAEAVCVCSEDLFAVNPDGKCAWCKLPRR